MTKTNVSGKGLLMFTVYSPSWKEVKVETWRQVLETGTEAEAMINTDH